MIAPLAIPGDALCTEEEYLSSEGTYSDGGIIRAAVIGKVMYDNINRRIYVKSLKPLKIPKAGSTVIGIVLQVRDDLAIVRILGYDIATTFKHEFNGLLHVSQAGESRAANQTMFEYVRPGDIIKAKVLNSQVPFLLNIREPRLGVILAYCSRCGSPLIRTSEGGNLMCPSCKNVEVRKTSIEYALYRR